MSFASLIIYAAAAAAISFFAYRFLYGTDTPLIKGLPEIPGLPLFGSLIELGENHALVAQQWAKKYGPVFQVRMGTRVSAPGSISKVSAREETIAHANQRIVFANSFDSVRHLWITNQSALISRPTLYTFHSVGKSVLRDTCAALLH